MRLKSLVYAVASCLLCAAVLAGCSIDLGTENLLRPPKTLGDEAEIEQLVSDTAGGKYTLKYPKTGSYRSAIIMYDLDSDGADESIAFYRKGDDIARIHMLVMYSNNEKWLLSSDILTDTTDIDCIDFADVNGDGKQEILLGTATYTTNINNLSCYSYSDGKTLDIECRQSYSAFCFGDFNQDGDDEVITLLLYSAENDAAASMLDYSKDKNTLYSKAQASMDSSIVKYKNVSVQKLDKDTVGVVVDGVFSNEDINTQVIYYSRELSLLRNPLHIDKAKSFTQRSIGIASTDVDEDGFVEIPAVAKMPDEKEATADSIAYRIEWFNFSASGEKAVSKLSMIVPNSLDFALKIPDSWNINEVSARYNYEKSSLEFFEWDKNKYGEKLFEIRAFDQSVWDMGKEDDYTLISKDNNIAYTFKKFSSDSALMLSDDEIKTAFTVLNAAV